MLADDAGQPHLVDALHAADRELLALHLLDEIVAEPVFLASELPEPTEADRRPPD